MNDIFNSSKICLNFHADYQRDYELTLNSRTFEILGSGSLELIDSVPGLGRMFKPNEDLAVMEDGRTALELCTSFLEDGDRRENVEASGNRRVLFEHTIDDRVTRILPVLEGLV
jgi:spore maturation protein CgeB